MFSLISIILVVLAKKIKIQKMDQNSNNGMRLKICTKFIPNFNKKEMSQKFDNLQKSNRLYNKTFGTNEQQIVDPIVRNFFSLLTVLSTPLATTFGSTFLRQERMRRSSGLMF